MFQTFQLRDPHPELARVRDRVIAAARELCPGAEVMEVGSSAVPGLPGKSDLDVLVRVPAARFEAARSALDEVFPRNDDQLSDAAFQGYRVPAPFDAAIQLTVAGGPYDDFVAFLEVLRADVGIREAYADLKRAWDGRPMDEYRAAKRAFVESVLAGR